MSIHTRINKVESALTPHQLAMLEVQRARSHPNMIAHALAAAAAPVAGRDSLAERIASSVRRRGQSEGRDCSDELVADAQKQGAFLVQLAAECNATVSGCLREQDLKLSLLEMMALLLTTGSGGTDGAWNTLETSIGRFLDETRALLGGVRLIERTYFQGESVLYPDHESSLVALLEGACDLNQVFEPEDRGGVGPNRRQEDGGPRNADSHPEDAGTNPGVRAMADQIIRMARAHVLEAFDDRLGAIRLVAGLLKKSVGESAGSVTSNRAGTGQ